MTTDLVLLEMADRHVAVVTLNRPEKRNAVSVELTQAMSAIIARIEQDPEVRCVVLTSSHPSVFSAGADLADVAAGRGAGLQTPEGGFAGFTNAPRMKPWIAAVEGAALAGGCELALTCDMIVASEAASFGVPEVKRGLIAGAGGVDRLPKYIPRNVALEMLATGAPIDAARAAALGLVNRLTPAGEAKAAAVALAQQIAANAPMAVQQSLWAARQVSGCDEAEGRALARTATATIMSSEDLKEGTRAFLEKRAPVWSGR
jgi:enoyl-CoA hydratase/carnithine racemase